MLSGDGDKNFQIKSRDLPPGGIIMIIYADCKENNIII